MIWIIATIAIIVTLGSICCRAVRERDEWKRQATEWRAAASAAVDLWGEQSAKLHDVEDDLKEADDGIEYFRARLREEREQRRAAVND